MTRSIWTLMTLLFALATCSLVSGCAEIVKTVASNTERRFDASAWTREDNLDRFCASMNGIIQAAQEDFRPIQGDDVGASYGLGSMHGGLGYYTTERIDGAVGACKLQTVLYSVSCQMTYELPQSAAGKQYVGISAAVAKCLGERWTHAERVEDGLGGRSTTFCEPDAKMGRSVVVELSRNQEKRLWSARLDVVASRFGRCKG